MTTAEEVKQAAQKFKDHQLFQEAQADLVQDLSDSEAETVLQPAARKASGVPHMQAVRYHRTLLGMKLCSAANLHISVAMQQWRLLTYMPHSTKCTAMDCMAEGIDALLL